MPNFSTTLTDPSFVPLIGVASGIVQQIAGIQFDERQYPMIISRLRRRMSELGLTDPNEYKRFIERNKIAESEKLVSLLTTHHTFFFRESEQLDFLAREGLAQIIAGVRKQNRNHIRVWSMATSKGHETYTLSMFLAHHLPKIAPGMTYEILGTDVDTECIATARNGVYRWEEVKTIPSLYLAGNWMRGTGDISIYARVKDHIKKPCRFETGNLLSIPSPSEVGTWDLIFCRNVFIYFKQHQISEIALRVRQIMEEHGLLIIGVSESLGEDRQGFHLLGGSIYSHSAPKPSATPVHGLASAPKESKPIRVMIVDDSPTIATMLKAILTKDEGFEVVGTATDGQQAAALAEKTSFDVMTLDLQMPNLDGFGYLEQYVKTNAKHPPVVVVSSRSRDDMDVGPRVMAAGARDFVEKPTMADLAERGTEIRSKLRVMASAEGKNANIADAAKLALSFAQNQPTWIEKSLRVVTISNSSLPWIKKYLLSESQSMVATLLVCQNDVDTWRLGHDLKANGRLQRDQPGDNEFSVMSMNQLLAMINLLKDRKATVAITSDCTDLARELIQAWPEAELLLEEGLRASSLDTQRWPRIVPRSSILADAERILRAKVA